MKLSEKIRTLAISGGEAHSLASEVENLEGALRDLLDCLKARADLSGASAYKGMGVNILQEKASKLPAAIRYAEQVLA